MSIRFLHLCKINTVPLVGAIHLVQEMHLFIDINWQS